MARPHLHDDGSTVTLDLHGATVDEGLRLVRRAAALASRRARSSLRVVHGSSTSDLRARNRTLKHALHDLLDDGALPEVTGDFRGEGFTLISLGVGGRGDPAPIRLSDLR
ncbi:MAG: Smr/MutS family protein [Rubricoccaceae bacterium]|nr:Smr/MutS family protein [Rubricoccaceae bacterium]